MAYDFSSQNSGSGFGGGFPPFGDSDFTNSPERGFPRPFGQKEEPEIKQTDEAAVVLMVKEDLKPWAESGRISPELSADIERQMLDFFRSEKKEPDVSRIKEMIDQIEANNKLLASDIKTSARQILEKLGEKNIPPELRDSNTFYQTEFTQQSLEAAVEDAVLTKPIQKPVADNQASQQTQALTPEKPAETIPAPIQTLENNQDRKIPIAHSKPVTAANQKPVQSSKSEIKQSGIIHLPLPNDSDDIQNIDLAA